MKTCFSILFLLGVTGCQTCTLTEPIGTPPTDRRVPGFPIGTYTSCAQGVHNPDGNVFLNTAGFESGAVLTLAQSGRTVMATYVDQNGRTQSLSFSATTRTSATLAEPARLMAAFSSLCVMGPWNERAYPASMNVTAGVMTYSAGMIFVSLTGGLQSDAGDCGMLSQPDATFWLLCEERRGGLPSTDAAPPPATQLPVGQYSCNSQVEAYKQVNGINHFVTGGRSGTLTLTQDGAEVSVLYKGDSYLAGTLRLGLITATTASAEAGQTLMSPCMIPMGTGGPSQTPQPLPIAAGSLSLVGSKLFLSFAGTTADGSSCPGAHVAGSVICSK